MNSLPVGWTEADWVKLLRAQGLEAHERTEEDWEILDRPQVWAESEDPEIYDLGASEMIDP